MTTIRGAPQTSRSLAKDWKVNPQQIGKAPVVEPCVAWVPGSASAQRGPNSRGSGCGVDSENMVDLKLFHFLIDNRSRIACRLTSLATIVRFSNNCSRQPGDETWTTRSCHGRTILDRLDR